MFCCFQSVFIVLYTITNTIFSFFFNFQCKLSAKLAPKKDIAKACKEKKYTALSRSCTVFSVAVLQLMPLEAGAVKHIYIGQGTVQSTNQKGVSGQSQASTHHPLVFRPGEHRHKVRLDVHVTFST